MSYKDWDSPSWRDDNTLSRHTAYNRRWAFFPVKSKNGEKIWLDHYYRVYRVWGNADSDDQNYSHKDFLGNITESEYIVRKLADNL